MNGCGKDVRTRHWGGGLFCSQRCAARFGIRAALDAMPCVECTIIRSEHTHHQAGDHPWRRNDR